MKTDNLKKHNTETIITFPFYKGTLQIFEVMQMIDIERDYKRNCQKAITRYKKWRDEYKQETDLIALMYLQLKGELLRRQAEDFINAYWRVRHDYRQAFSNYLEKNCRYQAKGLSVVHGDKRQVN